MEVKVVLLLTALASLAFATEDIKRARLEVGAIFDNFLPSNIKF
jgi:hypothetical protein